MARLAFLGSPPEAVGPLQALVSAGHDVALVVSQPERRRGRGSQAAPTPVAAAAASMGLAVSYELEDVASAGAEVAVVVAYGRIVPRRLLDAVLFVNLHFSLLPRWRGAAPVEAAIMAGDPETGVCLMRLVPELDAGPLYACERSPIGREETAGELRRRLSAVGTDLLVSRLAAGKASLGEAHPQQGPASHARKIERGELEVDFSQPAETLARLVRVGGAHSYLGGSRLAIRRARAVGNAGIVEAGGPEPGPDLVPKLGNGGGGQLAPPGPAELVVGPGGVPLVGTSDGWLELLEVQPEGRRSMAGREWLHGARLALPAVIGRPG